MKNCDCAKPVPGMFICWTCGGSLVGDEPKTHSHCDECGRETGETAVGGEVLICGECMSES